MASVSLVCGARGFDVVDVANRGGGAHGFEVADVASRSGGGSVACFGGGSFLGRLNRWLVTSGLVADIIFSGCGFCGLLEDSKYN